MERNEDYHSIANNDEKSELRVHPAIASAITGRVSVILIDISEISNIVFNPDKSEFFYKVYPTIEEKLKECMSKEKEIRIGDFADEEKMETLIALKFDTEGMKEKGLSISGSERLTPFDRNVLDAITTLCTEIGNKYISVNMIHHVLAGKRKKTSPNYAEEIDNSITKLMFTHIIAKSYYIDHSDELMDFTLLPATRVRAKLNGYEVSCIRIDGNLPLYMHAGFRDKIISLNLDLVNMPFAHNKNENKAYMDILYYLLRRIITIDKSNSHIKYETLYPELGLGNAHRQIKFDTRNRVKAILDAWKGLEFGNVTFIDYQEQKKGRIPYGITLDCKRSKKKKNAYQYEVSNEYF